MRALRLVLLLALTVAAAAPAQTVPGSAPPAAASSDQGISLAEVRIIILLTAASVFLAAFFALAVHLAYSSWRWLAGARRAREPRTLRAHLELRVTAPDGRRRLHSFNRLPVTLATSGTADLTLPARRPMALRIYYKEGQSIFLSTVPVIVNGVAQSRRRLRPGDRITFGAHRVQFLGAGIERIGPSVPERPAFAWRVPALAALFSLWLLFWRAAEQPPGRQQSLGSAPAWEPEPAEAPEAAPVSTEAPEAAPVSSEAPAPAPPPPASSREPAPPPASPAGGTVPSRTPAQEPPQRPRAEARTASAPAGASPAPARADGRQKAAPAGRATKAAEEAGSSAAVSEAAAAAVRRVHTRVVGPGQEIPFFPADILFIHAHPDDESLDFGVLMARATRAGLRVAVVLFTDGESGLDLFPARTVGAGYPAGKLSGPALARVRVGEATAALSILGAELYVRLALRNAPYNGVRDEIPIAKVIKAWGGEQALEARLSEIIAGFHPRILVAPDGPSAAHEHFEHEAVGYLVRRTWQLMVRGGQAVPGYLVSVDPLQRDRYPRPLVEVDALGKDPDSGLTYRDIQALALHQHRTQRDAAVLGVQHLSHLAEEYYRKVSWKLEGSLADYLR